MPTSRGWVLAFGAVAAGFSGRLLGVRELFATAAAGEAVLLAALVFVWCRRVHFRVERRLWPDRVPVGGTSLVDLELTNQAPHRSPALLLDDGHHRLATGSLRTHEAARWTYPFRAARRGLVPVGPVRVWVTDPLGVAHRSVQVGSVSTLTVHPYVDDIELPPEPPAAGPAGGARPVVASTFAGEDFHALRPYIEGDNLRQVHWPTTARRGELFVRQDEVPRPRDTVVGLDLRKDVHDPDSRERAISAAASVLVAAAHDDGLVRLVTTGGIDSGTAGGAAHVSLLLDYLAGVVVDDATGLGPTVANMGVDVEGTTVVMVTASAVSPVELAAVAALRHAGAEVTIVCFEVPGHPLELVGATAASRGPGLVPVGRTSDFRVAWARGVGRDLVSPAPAGSA